MRIKSISSVFACFLAFSTYAETITGYVVGIADGDTITVLDANRQQHKIRLAGIDAPENTQAFGDSSKQNLAAMVFNKTVAVEWDKQDRYGRTVGKVIVNGVDANAAQIKAGMVWWYEQYHKEQSLEDQRLYEQVEQQAKAQRVGLWRDLSPMAPWVWRNGGSVEVKQSCPCGSGAACTGSKGGRYCITPTGGKRYK